MTISDARNWCNAQVGKSLDFDGQYGAQCFDFFNFYYQFITGRNPYGDGYALAGAKDIYGVPNSRFQHIPNNPNDLNQLPPDLAIMILNQNIGGGYGHVQVVDHADPSGYWAWEQNWAGPYVEHRYHTWGTLNGKITGWLVYNGFSTNNQSNTEDADMGMSTDFVTNMYRYVAGRQPSSDEVASQAANGTPASLLNGFITNNDLAVVHLGQTIDQLNAAVTAANSQTSASKADLQAALAKVTNLTNQLSDDNDQLAQLRTELADAQKQISSTPQAGTPVTKQPDSPGVDWGALATNLWNSILKFINQFKH